MTVDRFKCLKGFLFVVFAPDEGQGNEYGITNVSSQGKVSITVVPPRYRASRSRSRTPFDSDRAGVRGASPLLTEPSGVSHSTGLTVSRRQTTSSTSRDHHPDSADQRLSLKELYYRKRLQDAGD